MTTAIENGSTLSFRTDRDIRESLEIMGRHAAVLDSGDVLVLHGQRMRSCARCLGRAVFQLNANRATLVLQTCWMARQLGADHHAGTKACGELTERSARLSREGRA